jgi:hypothetical protein
MRCARRPAQHPHPRHRIPGASAPPPRGRPSRNPVTRLFAVHAVREDEHSLPALPPPPGEATDETTGDVSPVVDDPGNDDALPAEATVENR